MRLGRALLVSVPLLVIPLGTAPRAATTGQTMAEAAGRGLLGSAAPRMVVTTIDGERIDLGSLYGKKAVYIKFWATWCVPCREQMPHFEHVYETAGPDLAVIAVNAGFNDSIDDIRNFRRQTGIRMPIVFDGDGALGATFNLRVTPQHVVIGRDGRVQYVGHYADRTLDAALLAARTPSTAPGITPVGKEPTAGLRYGMGDVAPDVVVTTLDGRLFPIRPAGTHVPTVLVFLSPWCESYLANSRPIVSERCRTARREVTALSKGRRFRWLGVASGLWATADDLRDYRAKYKPGIPLTLDESGLLFRSFQVAATPTLIIVDADGRVARRIEGPDAASIREDIENQH